MAFERLGGPKTFINLKEHSAGDVLLEGIFTHTYQGMYGDNYQFRCEPQGDVVIGSVGHLKYCMKEVNQGDYIRLIYNGREILTKGAFKGKSAHTFELLRDPEKSIASVTVPPVEPVLDPDVGGDDLDSFGDL